MKKKISYLGIFILLLILFGIKPNASTLASGYCGGEGDGTNLTWTLDSDMVLTISGKGAMQDFIQDNSGFNVPWLSASTVSYSNPIKKAVIKEGVTTIGNYAFPSYFAEGIEIPYSVTKIGNYAFMEADFTSIELPNNLQSIGIGVFYSNLNLTYVRIPDSVTYMGGFNTFIYCSKLETVSLPMNVEINDTYQFFKSCSSLNNVTLPYTLNIIGTYMFADCDALTSIIIPASVTEIKGSAFSSCDYLTDIYFLGDLPTINEYAFSYVGYENSLTVTAYFLKDAEGISALTEPITIWGGYTSFKMNTDWAYNQNCGTNCTWTLDTDGTLTISGTGNMKDYGPSSTNFSPWYFIRNYIKNIDVAEGIISIGDQAFWDIDQLTSCTIPESVTKLGRLAFGSCQNLSDINLSKNIVSIGDSAFEYCASLKNIILPEKLNTLYQYAFMNCDKLSSITIPKNVSNIYGAAFYDCYSLKKIYFEGNLPTFTMTFVTNDNNETVTLPIFRSVAATVYYPSSGFGWSKSAMDDCGGELILAPSGEVSGDCGATESDKVTWILSEDRILTIKGSGNMAGYTTNFVSENKVLPPWYFAMDEITKVIIETGVTGIGTAAFYDCKNLLEVSLPDSLLNIGGQAFGYCDSLTKIKLPDSITSLGYDMFWYCTNLEEVNIPAGISLIDECTFFECTSLKSITIPSNVKSIGYLAFFDCTALQTVVLEEGIEKIGQEAFENCYALNNISFPNSLKEIGSVAFYNCNKLGTIIFKENLSLIGDRAFGCAKLENVYFNGNLPTVEEFAFYSHDTTTNIYYPIDNITWNNVTADNLGGVPENINCVLNIMGHEHAWKFKSTINAATCLTSGNHIEQCSICKLIKTVDDPQLEHTAGEWKITKAATCTNHGEKTQYCANGCNTVYAKETVPKISHDYKEIITNPTCTKDGSKIYKCTGCNTVDETKTVIIKATGHSGTWKQVKVPSCLNNGFGRDDKYCDKCGTLIDQRSYLDSTDHVWGEWELQAEQDVFGPEVQIRTCTVCHNAQDKKTIGEAIKPTIKVNYTNIPLQKGKSTTKIKVTGLAKNDYIESWTSNKKSIATVTNSGKITGKKVGTAKITVKLASGLTKTITVKVQKGKVKANYITMVGTNKFTLQKGKKLDLPKTLQLTLIPVTTSETIKYSSSNEKIATVNSKGVVTAKKPGKVKITMIPGSNKKNKDDTITITVPKVITTKITLNKTNLTLKKGKTYTLKATIKPSDSDDDITFKSSKKSVATVNSKGKITAKKKGTATITVTSGKKKVTCKVTVK